MWSEQRDPRPPEQARRETSLARNTVAQMSPTLLGYVLSFLAAPVVLSGLGLRMFGVWALTAALAQYGGLLDLGSGRSLSRFVAAHQNDRRACGEYIALGGITAAVVSLVLLLATVVGAPLLAHILHGISASQMRLVLACSVGLLACTMATLVVMAYPVGLRRMVAPNVGIAAGVVLNFVASVGAIALGWKLPGYALANLGAGVVTVLVVTVLVVRAEGSIPLSRPTLARARELLPFGGKLQLAWAMELINYQSDKIVIAFAVGPAAAGSYELANRVAAAARQVGIFPSTALLPTLTARSAKSGLGYLRAAYGRLTEVIASASFPFLVIVAALTPMLFSAWLGRIPEHAEVILPALAIPYLVSMSSDVGRVVAFAAGDPSVVARTAVYTAVANLILTATLAPVFGLWGVLGGTVVALTGGALIQLRLVQHQFGLSGASYI
ncbi:MAG TPA: oligosaccharide flippase family protein, partial [Dehalococcoidia bacterium]|nr:oligosaccharide flippase family protein [Dehalococcoidia bacterium]